MAEGSSTSRVAVHMHRVLTEHREAERHFEAKREQEKRDHVFALRLSMQEFGEQPSQERKNDSASSAGGWLHDGVKPRIATECLVTDGSSFSERGKRRSLPGGFNESEPPRKVMKPRLSLAADVHVRNLDRHCLCGFVQAVCRRCVTWCLHVSFISLSFLWLLSQFPSMSFNSLVSA